jgi:hypothetical protein
MPPAFRPGSPPPPPPPANPPPLSLSHVVGPPDTIGHLVVEVSGHMNAGRLSFWDYVPYISVNGAPLMVLRKGPTLMALPAGHHHLTVGVGSDVAGAFHYGRAHIVVTVVPHRTTTVYYRAPWTSLSRGAIGFTPQKAPDTLAATLLIGGIIAFPLVGILGMLF